MHRFPASESRSWFLALSAFLLAGPALADDERPPLLAGPVLLGPAPAQVRSAALRVRFGESARTAEAEYALTIEGTQAGETLLGFAGRGVRSIRATVNGAPAAVEPAATPLPLGGGPFDQQVTIRVAVLPGTVAAVAVTVLCETSGEERNPRLTYPQATFITNWLLDGPRAQVLRIQPGPALAQAAAFALRVESAAPRRPEAPVEGAVVSTPDGAAVEGFVADPSGAFEVAAVEGEYETPKNWGIAFGMGLALDWPRTSRNVTDPATGDVIGTEYDSRGADEVNSRVWFRGLVEWAFRPAWIFETGVEGDFKGALEIPATFVWFPMSGTPGRFDVFGDCRLFGGLAVQLLNNLSAGEKGFDPRVFLRLGGGIRLLMVTIEAAYEIAPPLGAWDGERGGLEHKFLLTIPWVF